MNAAVKRMRLATGVASPSRCRPSVAVHECGYRIRNTARMSIFERYLTVWVFLCIVIGITLGQFLPGVFQVIGGLSVAHINLQISIMIWLMIIPMLVKVDFGALV